MIRTRLTLWNSLVFAATLSLIGWVIYASTCAQIYRGIDDDLAQRSDGLQQDWAHGHVPPEANDPRHGPDGGHDHHHDDGGGPPGPPDQPPNDTPPPGSPPGEHYTLRGDRKGEDWTYEPASRDRSSSEMPRKFIQEIGNLDPIEARRLEFSARVNRPRVFRINGSPMGGPPDQQPFDPYALTTSFHGAVSVDTVNLDGHRLRVRSVPLTQDGHITATAQFATDLGEADSVVGRLRTTLLALVPAAFIVTSLLGIWLTGRALRPVRRIADTAETIQATDLSRRLPVDGNDEFAYLSKRFNGMLERIQASFTAQRQFVSDASHELKTPLTVIKGRSGLALSSGQTAERYQEHLRAIDKAADGMAAIVGDLLLLAQADENKLALDFRPILVSQLVAEALDGTSDKTRFALDLREGLKVQADPLLARRALSNVIANAERHNDKGRPILISGHRDGDGIEIAVIDEGEGIPAEHLPNIFDRFHRVDPSRDKASGGTGLGLAIVKSIMEAHGGRVSLSSELGRGTQVRLWFPAA